MHDIDSKLLGEFDSLPFVDVCRRMNLVEGPDEYVKPKNFALMFFNDHPEKIFPQSQIELIQFQDGDAGGDFSEMVFTGPIHNQLKETLRYLRSQVIKELVQKVSYQPEAIRSYNYPYEALEEIVANSLYHRDYQTIEPVEIRVYPDFIVFLNYGGPNRSFDPNKVQVSPLFSRRYRNRRLGDFLKELDLTEGKATGIPIIKKALENNGSPEAEFETDEDRSYFQVILRIHPEFVGDMADVVSGVVSGVVIDLLRLISKHPGNRVPFFVDKMNAPTRSVQRWLEILRKEKKIEFRGAPRTGGYWEVNK